MANGNLRFDHSAITVEHASARGRVFRNVDGYTRGAGLIGAQWALFKHGIRIPVYTTIAIFVAVFWIMMSAAMGDHEISLCAWRIWSSIWTWMDFDKFKPMNIVLTDGSIRRVSIGYIPYVPDVQWAWHKALRTLAGALLASILIAIPIVSWFLSIASKRSAAALEERHERGAMLVNRRILHADILAHNRKLFTRAAARLFPGKDPLKVERLPYAERRAAGLHCPYSLGGIPYPYGLEQSHTIIVGTTGSGKTTQMRNMVAEMRARGDSAVIFDLTGAFVEAFYDPKTDIILNPGDARCASWSFFKDCTNETEITSAAAAIVPNDGGNVDVFWPNAARGLFVEMCLKLKQLGLTTNKAIATNLMYAPLKRIHEMLKGTAAAPYTALEGARMAEAIRATYNINGKALANLPDDGVPFSIREWIMRKDKPGSIFFVTSRHTELVRYKTLLTLWLDIAVNTLMTLPRTDSLRTWFFFDEVGALHRLPAIESGLQTARGHGGGIVLGMHSFARLRAVYGHEGAENLTSLARTKLVLATADRKTAEQCSEFIGYREVRQVDESNSYGASNVRDAATLTQRKQIEPLVIPDDIVGLPALHGFVKFPDGFPAARVMLKWHNYPTVAVGFEPRLAEDQIPPEDPKLMVLHAEDDGSEGGGRDQTDSAVTSSGASPAALANDQPAPTLPAQGLTEQEKYARNVVGAPVAEAQRTEPSPQSSNDNDQTPRQDATDGFRLSAAAQSSDDTGAKPDADRYLARTVGEVALSTDKGVDGHSPTTESATESKSIEAQRLANVLGDIGTNFTEDQPEHHAHEDGMGLEL